MFTGIIEEITYVTEIKKEQNNLHIYLKNPFKERLKINQSIAHNGVCLSLNEIHPSYYKVVAIEETLKKSNLKHLQIGDCINLERAMRYDDRFEGHLLQGHVDMEVAIKKIETKKGSWMFYFIYDPSFPFQIVEKGSIAINGVSLTLVEINQDSFSTAIIPFTYEKTNFHTLKTGDYVNIEFDIIGKYIEKITKKYFFKA